MPHIHIWIMKFTLSTPWQVSDEFGNYSVVEILLGPGAPDGAKEELSLRIQLDLAVRKIVAVIKSHPNIKINFSSYDDAMAFYLRYSGIQEWTPQILDGGIEKIITDMVSRVELETSVTKSQLANALRNVAGML